MSGWYQRAFPTRLSAQRQAVPEFETTTQGCRFATSVGGVLTGRGADIIIIDDPLKPDEALSQTRRQAANEWIDHTLYSRLNDKQKGSIILIMHRLHEDDLVGHVLAQEDWEVVHFPAIAEEDETWRSRRYGDRGILPVGGARRCTPSGSRRQCSSRSAGRSGSITSPANTSRPRRHWAALSSRRRGSSITRRLNCRRPSTASCRAGTPPTRRPSSAISASA